MPPGEWVWRIVQPCTCLTPLCGWTPCDINATYTSLKSAFTVLQFRRSQYGSISIRLAVIASETREMSRNSKRIWPYSSSKSSKVVDLGVNGKPICDFILVINSNFSRICCSVFEIFTVKYRKLLILPTHALFDAPWRQNAMTYRRNLYTAEKCI